MSEGLLQRRRGAVGGGLDEHTGARGRRGDEEHGRRAGYGRGDEMSLSADSVHW